MTDDKKPAGDEHMGAFVYCKSHVGPHSTGWCTVYPENKISLKATTAEAAYAEVRQMGLHIFGEPSALQLRVLSQMSPDYEGAGALLIAHWDVHDEDDRWEIVGVRERDGALEVRHVMRGTKSYMSAETIYCLTTGAGKFVGKVREMWGME